MKTLYAAITDALVASGVRHAFGLMGEDTAALITDLVDRGGVEFFATRHDAAAVAAADGYAWKSGGVGVAIVSRGPGFANMMTAAVTAVKGRRQLLVIVGDGAVSPGPGPDLKQLDHAGMAAAAGLELYTARDAGQLTDAWSAAFRSAQSGKPAVLSVPIDLLGTAFGEEPIAVGDQMPPQAKAIARVSPEQVDQVVALLAESQRPLILAGRGATNADAKRTLEALAERTGALLGTTLVAKDLFRGHPLDLGTVGGFAADGSRTLLDQVDCLLVFGASLTSFTTAMHTLFRDIPIVHVDIDSASINANFPVTLGIVADAAEAAGQLLEAVSSSNRVNGHRDELFAPPDEPAYAGEDLSSATEIDPRALARTCDGLLPEDATVIQDGGHHMAFSGAYVRVAGPNHFRATGACQVR